jgi:hypothetical protein
MHHLVAGAYPELHQSTPLPSPVLLYEKGPWQLWGAKNVPFSKGKKGKYRIPKLYFLPSHIERMISNMDTSN